MDETFLASLFEHLSDGVCISDAQSFVLYLNPAARRLLGTDPEQARGKTLCEVLCRHLFAPGWRSCEQACPLRGLVDDPAGVTMAGEYLPMNLSPPRDLRIRCLRAPAGEPEAAGWRLTLIEDAGARRELERRTEDWRHMAAHDMRTPLTAMICALEVMARDPRVRAAGSVRYWAELCLQDGYRLLELMEAYVAVAQLDAGMLPIFPQRVRVRGLLLRGRTLQAALAGEGSLVLEVPESLEAVADPDLLARVLEALAANSVRRSPRDGSVVVRGEHAEEGVRLVFRDSGPGFSAGDAARLTDRESQDSLRREGRMASSSVALVFCHEALKAMGGGLEIVPRTAGGEFVARLPD